MNHADSKDPDSGSEPHAERRPKPIKRKLFDIRTYFLTGLVVAAPIAITVYLTYAFITFVDGQVARLLPASYHPDTYLPFGVPGLGVILVFTALVFLGALTANFFGRWLVRMGERIVDRMPVVRTIYNATKQIFETVLTQSDQSFKEVALVQYPRKGIWAIAFVTGSTRGEIQARNSEELISVFLPTTPNPTSGFLLFLPKKEVTILDMSVEEGAKLVISGGLVTPPYPRPAKPDIKGRIEGHKGETASADKTALPPPKVQGPGQG